MAELPRPSADYLLDTLEALIALPGSPGHPDDLAKLAQRIRSLMQTAGLDTQLLTTSGPPIVVGQRSGTHPFTLMLYHHYDCLPPGPFRIWNHDPHCLSERDGLLYGRGVADSRGPLAAHLSALAAYEGELPCNIIIIAEGSFLSGSPQLAEMIAAHRENLRADACLASQGERDSQGFPICYSGAKGLLQLRLQVQGAQYGLPAGLATSVPNPLWRLLWALAHIKSDQEEILIEGFYDAVDGPERHESRAIRETSYPDEERMSHWQMSQMLFALSGSDIVQAEVTLPTCNVTSIQVEPSTDLALIPTSARALIDFQLVPRQHPTAIFDLLREHLNAKGLADIQLERLPGGYPSAHTAISDRIVLTLSESGKATFGSPLPILPRGAFVAPLSIFAQAYRIPVVSLGMQRPESRTHAANECIPLDDLLKHAEQLMTFMDLITKQSTSL